MVITLNETAMTAARAAYNDRDAPTFRVLSEAIRAYLGALSAPAAPVAYAYVIDGECEEIGWGKPPLEDPSLVLLFTSEKRS